MKKHVTNKKRLCARFLAIGVSAITVVLLSLPLGFLSMQPDYILSRINPDFTINTDFVDPDSLKNASWSTMEQISYEDGKQISSTIFKRKLFGDYSVTHQALDSQTLLTGSVEGKYSRHEYLELDDTPQLYLRSHYSYDSAGQVDYLYVSNDETDTLLNMIRLERLDNDYLLKQLQTAEDGTVLKYRTYDYTNDRIEKTHDYNAEDELLSYALYSYSNNSLTIEEHTANDVLIGIRTQRFDVFGRISHQERYDASGILLSHEVYHYRIWELYCGTTGIIFFAIILCLAALAGVTTWEHLDNKKDLPNQQTPQ